MKLAGLLMLLCGCVTAGILASRNLRQQAEITGKLGSLLDLLAAHIRFQSLPLEDLFALAAERPELMQLTFLQGLSFAPDIPFSAAWEQAVRKSDILPATTVPILLSLGSSLGTTDAQGQLSALAVHRQELLELEQDMKEKYRSHGALYRKLGILGGITLVLLLA